MNFNYYITIIQFFIVNILNIISDMISSILINNYNMNIYSIIFLRHIFQYFFCLCMLLLKGRWRLHLHDLFSPSLIIQSLVLWLGFYFWDYGLMHSSLLSVTVVSFTLPIFTLLFCTFFLKEKIDLSILYYNTLFMTLFFAFLIFQSSFFCFNISFFYLILGALFFSFIDVLQQHYFNQEKNASLLNMMAIQSFWVLCLTFLLEKKEKILVFPWDQSLLIYILLLGLSTSMMIGLWLLCLKSQKILSRIQPLYYFNFIVAALLDIFFFERAYNKVLCFFCFLILIGLIAFIIKDFRKNHLPQ
jgi:S-adenosylmethionine uptake transporter